MTYCTQQNLIDRFAEDELIQLTDRDNVGVIDTNVLDLAISDASAEIDSYLAAYPLPLTVIPTGLTRIACNIARFYLYDDNAPEHIEKLYENSINYLKAVAQGKISLGVDSAGQQAVASDNAVMESGGRVFSRDDNGFM